MVRQAHHEQIGVCSAGRTAEPLVVSQSNYEPRGGGFFAALRMTRRGAVVDSATGGGRWGKSPLPLGEG